MTSKQRRPFISRTLRGALVAIGTTTIACLVASSPRTTFSPLLNSGVMPISEDNPFMGANLFLAQQMEQSVYLYNFMKDKGAPQGLELKGDSEDDVEAHLYYTAGPEEYIAKPAPRKRNFARTKDIRREWIIIGPFAIDREHYRDVERLEKTSGGVFEIFGKREYLGRTPVRGSDQTLRPVFIPTAVPTKVPVRHKKPSAEGQSGSPAITDAKGPLNFDQQALKESLEMAPRDGQGDIIHTVIGKTETLQSIAQWYTGKGDNAKDLASKNLLPPDAKLSPGTKVIVPKSLITTPKRMK